MTDAAPLTRYHWRKVFRKLTRSRALRRAPVAHRWLWIILLLLPDDLDGFLVQDGFPLTIEDIADEAALEVEDTRVGVEYLIDCNMLELEGGAYRVVNFKKYQVSPEAVRKRRQRSRRPSLPSDETDGTEDRGTEDRDSGDSHVTCPVTCHAPDSPPA